MNGMELTCMVEVIVDTTGDIVTLKNIYIYIYICIAKSKIASRNNAP